MSIKTKIGNFNFENCVMNASGIHCKDRKQMDELNASNAGTFVTKTATLEPRDGNPSPPAWSLPLGTINSMGLPNYGIDYYLAYLEEMEANNPVKPFILSVAELTEDKIYQIAERVHDSNFEGLTELNLSCPNVPGKAQIGYDFEAVDRILETIFVYYKKPLGVKLPPYFDFAHFDQMAEILNKYPLTFVNSINSLGNGLGIEDEKVVIKPKDGFGGIGGQYIKPFALANVHAFYQRLNPSIQLIGTGGVTNGRDVFELILCGASMVQVGSQLYFEGIDVFDQLSQELEVIMEEKGYESIEDFRGKLTYID